MKKIACILLIVVLLSASCCLAQEREISLTQVGDRWVAQMFAMDTFIQATIYTPTLDGEHVTNVMRNVSRLESLFSTTDAASEISMINAADGEKRSVSEDTGAVLQIAAEISNETGGAFDVTAYPLVKAWGFTQSEYRVPDAEEIASLLEKVDYRKVTLCDQTVLVPSGMEIDLGGIAKGYTGDVLTTALRENGVESALLSLGGNIALVGRKPDGSLWKVGVRDPLNTDENIGYIQVEDTNVITSGGYERYFKDENGDIWWHIIDPKTGYPARNGLISVTVIGKNGAKCDALSTALFVMGTDAASTYLSMQTDVEAILICEDGSLRITDGLQGNFTPMGAYQAQEIQWICR